MMEQGFLCWTGPMGRSNGGYKFHKTGVSEY